jgi:deaminated glutathione amidase
MHSDDNKQANFTKAQTYILKATKNNPDIICLPENFLYRGTNEVHEADTLSSEYISTFQELARTNKVNIVLGSIALKAEEEKVTNSCLIINRWWEIIHRYDKIYMYDVERDDFSFSESTITQPGDKLGFFEIEGVKMGVGICVDIRYPEYFRELIKLGAEIIFLPSSFSKLTWGIAWDVLTKARAIENQVYFCACGQTGDTGVKERCGNSRIISFDGKIIAEMGQEEGIVSADIDLEIVHKFRKEFPVLRQMK